MFRLGAYKKKRIKRNYKDFAAVRFVTFKFFVKISYCRLKVSILFCQSDKRNIHLVKTDIPAGFQTVGKEISVFKCLVKVVGSEGNFAITKASASDVIRLQICKIMLIASAPVIYLPFL